MTPQDALFAAEAIMRRVDLGAAVYLKKSTFVAGYDHTGYWIEDSRQSGESWSKLTREECALLVAGELQQVNRTEPARRYLHNGVAGTLGAPNITNPHYYAWRPCAAEDCYAAPDWVHISRLTPLD